jgi:hypothetical protein
MQVGWGAGGESGRCSWQRGLAGGAAHRSAGGPRARSQLRAGLGLARIVTRASLLARPPDLTDLGQAQAQSLNSMLAGGGWFKKITGGRPARAIVSPLTR